MLPRLSQSQGRYTAYALCFCGCLVSLAAKDDGTGYFLASFLLQAVTNYVLQQLRAFRDYPGEYVIYMYEDDYETDFNVSLKPVADSGNRFRVQLTSTCKADIFLCLLARCEVDRLGRVFPYRNSSFEV